MATLAQAVRDAFDGALGPAARHIQSTVDNARVTLDGVVEVAQHRDTAERAVRRLAFVLDVANTLRASTRTSA